MRGGDCGERDEGRGLLGKGLREWTVGEPDERRGLWLSLIHI